MAKGENWQTTQETLSPYILPSAFRQQQKALYYYDMTCGRLDGRDRSSSIEESPGSIGQTAR
jgi:hypothetical protein